MGGTKGATPKLLLVLFFLAGFFCFGKNARASIISGLFISEVAIGINSAQNEFVEIKNISSEKLDLAASGIKLKLVNSSGKPTSKKNKLEKYTSKPRRIFSFRNWHDRCQF